MGKRLQCCSHFTIIPYIKFKSENAGFISVFYFPFEQVEAFVKGPDAYEKLVEELVAGHERVEATLVSNLLCVTPDPLRDFSRLTALVARLEESAAEGSVSHVLSLLGSILPTYRPGTPSGLSDIVHEAEGGAADDAPASAGDHVTVSGLSPIGPRRRT